LPTVTSDASKPATLSENVAVTVKAALVTAGAALESVRAGRVTSAMRESCVAAVLPLPPVSLAASAATSTVTAPSAAGVTVNE